MANSIEEWQDAIFLWIAKKERKSVTGRVSRSIAGLQPPLEVATRGAFHRGDKSWSLQARSTDMGSRCRRYCTPRESFRVKYFSTLVAQLAWSFTSAGSNWLLNKQCDTRRRLMLIIIFRKDCTTIVIINRNITIWSKFRSYPIRLSSKSN